MSAACPTFWKPTLHRPKIVVAVDGKEKNFRFEGRGFEGRGEIFLFLWERRRKRAIHLLLLQSKPLKLKRAPRRKEKPAQSVLGGSVLQRRGKEIFSDFWGQFCSSPFSSGDIDARREKVVVFDKCSMCFIFPSFPGEMRHTIYGNGKSLYQKWRSHQPNHFLPLSLPPNTKTPSNRVDFRFSVFGGRRRRVLNFVAYWSEEKEWERQERVSG